MNPGVQIPKPLKVMVNVQDMTLDELCLFDSEGFTPFAFRSFLINHTNWSKAEIGLVKVGELEDVAKQLADGMKTVVPLPSKPLSATGPVALR